MDLLVKLAQVIVCWATLGFIVQFGYSFHYLHWLRSQDPEDQQLVDDHWVYEELDDGSSDGFFSNTIYGVFLWPLTVFHYAWNLGRPEGVFGTLLQELKEEHDRDG